jgi:hypothetical protein
MGFSIFLQEGTISAQQPEFDTELGRLASKERAHPYLMRIHPGKDLDPSEVLVFKRTTMFDNVEYYTKGNKVYFKKMETPPSQTTQASQ